METPNETPLDPILPPEVVAKIRAIVAKSQSQQYPAQISIDAGVRLTATGTVFRPSVKGSIESSGTVTPRFIYRPLFAALSESSASGDPQQILQTFLKDPATSKRIWESPLALIIIPIIAQILIIFYQEYREDLREIDSAKFIQTIVPAS